MKYLGRFIYSILPDGETITNAVGTRIIPFARLDERTLPAITYTGVGRDTWPTLSNATAFYTRLVQIDIWSTTYDQCQTLADAVVTRLAGYTGSIDLDEATSITIQSCLLREELDMPEGPHQDKQEPIYRVVQRYEIAYSYATVGNN